MGRADNFQDGKIYKLISNESAKCYIGSTTEQYLSSRLAKRRGNHKNWLKGKRYHITSFEILKFDDCQII